MDDKMIFTSAIGRVPTEFVSSPITKNQTPPHVDGDGFVIRHLIGGPHEIQSDKIMLRDGGHPQATLEVKTCWETRGKMCQRLVFRYIGTNDDGDFVYLYDCTRNHRATEMDNRVVNIQGIG